jgi:ribosomal protein uS5
MSEPQKSFGKGKTGRGTKPQGGRRPGRPDDKKWTPVTKLGRMVFENKIKSLEEIFKFSIPIKESEIVDRLIGESEKYKEEVMKVKSVQKQTTAGQRTRMKVWVLIGDGNGHIGLGQKAHKEVQGAVAGAIIQAKMNLIPVRMGYWGNNIGQPHTIPFKISGKEGSVMTRLIPAPRGTGIVGPVTTKKVLLMAGIRDCYTQSCGSTKTRGNTLYSCYKALTLSYSYMTPEFWGKPSLERDLIPIEKKAENNEDDM